MMGLSIYSSSLFALILGAISPHGLAAPLSSPASPSEKLDQTLIHSEYRDGNFEKMAQALENFAKRNKHFSREDSVFLAKHLAVVYSANPATREKGKYHMYRLLELQPTARLADMFVSEEIDRIFEKVREEYLTQHGPAAPNYGRAPAPESPEKKPIPMPREKANQDKGPSKSIFWIAGGTGLIAAGVVGFYLMQGDEEKPREITKVIPEK